MRRVLAAMLTVAVCGLPSTVASADPSTPTGPFLTLLFSRTEVTAASNCAMDDTGIERLDTVVAPTLAALGIRPVGTIATGATRTDSFYCAHYSSTLGASWNLERELAHKYGWSFVSHTSTYAHGASDWEQSPTSIYDQTCGSRDRITAEGLPGAEGLLAWADNYVYPPAISTVDQCFDFNRIYGEPVTDRSSAVVDHTEWTRGIGGGSCNLPTQPCASYQGPHGMQTYRSPTAFSAYIANAQPDQWITLQSYVLVDGAVPGKWDCTSPDWHAHWTYDAERYCWNDYLSIVKSIPPNVVVTDPASVAKAWGRSLDTDAPGPLASISITPGTTLAHIGDVVPFTVAGRDAFGHDLGDVTATATLSIDGAASCDASSCTATAPGSYTVTADVGGVQSTATMIVVGGSVASLVLTAPPAASIGTTAAMSVEAFDADGNDLGDVTAAAALAIGPDGTCIANRCSAFVLGDHTITASIADVTGDTTLGIVPGAPATLHVSGPTLVATRAANPFRVITADAFGDELADVSATATLSAAPVGTCGAGTCTLPSAGNYTVGARVGPLVGGTRVLAAQPPSSTSFTPRFGPPGATVVVTGSGFTGTTEVDFGDTPCAFSVVSPTQMAITIPATAEGSASLRFAARGVSSTSVSQFRVSPTISSFTPTSATPGATITITGTGYSATTAVLVGGLAAAFTIDSPTQITVLLPSGVLTGRITVVANSVAGRSAKVLRVPPAITAVTPASGTVGSTVTITGTAFTGAYSVAFNGVATTFTVDSPTQITAVVPVGALRTQVSVSTPGGMARRPVWFRNP